MSIATLLRLVAPAGTGSGSALKDGEHGSILDLLEVQRSAPELILYGSSFNQGTVFMHSILVPAADIARARNADDLTHWQGNPHESWSCGLVWGGGRPPRVELRSPLFDIRTKVFRNAQQLVFGRSFDGRTEDQHYFEIAPALAHAHGLHWTPERRAWCRFDGNGDIEDVIAFSHEPGRGGYGTAHCITIKREVLEMHMSATRTVLAQMFDSTRVPPNFQGWRNSKESSTQDVKRGLYFRSNHEGATHYFRGTQIIRPKRTKQGYGKYLYNLQHETKQYESFITLDWKSKRIALVSCAPTSLASYFDRGSPLPFQTSPVFFNAAVLDKYRADPDKYALNNRSITCRNAWHLQTFDVNDAGQVHTYITYLGHLPHSEQLYWKSFNEAPKAGISKRAYITDFEGNFDQEPDSLRDLHYLVSELDRENAPWFKLHDPHLLTQLNYPLTASRKIWGDVLITLAKLVVEGLDRKYFQHWAKQLGREGDVKWGSILWAKEALSAHAADDSVIADIIRPLHELQKLRTKLGAHVAAEEAKALRGSLLRRHKSPKAHIEHLCAELVQSLKLLKSLCEK